jgi:hypothetical protein
MYKIIALSVGTFRCVGQLQDGIERWDMPTLSEAIKSMKQFAKTMNGMKIKKKNIEFLRIEEVRETRLVQYKP